MIYRKFDSRYLFLIILFVTGLISLSAKPSNALIRIIAGLDPYTLLQSSTTDSQGNQLAFEGNLGFGTGIEVFAIVNDWLDLGVGIIWNIPKQLEKGNDSINELVQYIPFFFSSRFTYVSNAVTDFYIIIRVGYSIFDSTDEYRAAITPNSSTFTQIQGGLFTSAVFGVSFHAIDKPQWGMSFSFDGAYTYQMANGVENGNNSLLHYHGIYAGISMDLIL